MCRHSFASLLLASVVVAASIPASVLASGPAAAADRPVFKAPPPVAAPAAFSFTGFYGGVHRGYGLYDINQPGEVPEPTGYFYGAQLGANYQFAPNWLIGLELDASYARIEDASMKIDPPPLDLQADHIILRALATLRARFGYVFDRNLVYVTGGAAWGSLHLNSGSSNVGDPNGPAIISFTPSLRGWTIGAGFERALYGNWTTKVEYLYTRFGAFTITDSVGSTTLKTELHSVKFGVNYLFGQGLPPAPAAASVASRMPVKAPPRAVETVWSWSGFYAGTHFGYGALDLNQPGDVPKPTGGFAGGQVGLNHQFANNWVVGVEFDAALARIEDTSMKRDPTPLDLQADQAILRALASLRARLGYAWERNLVYVTGGAAWGSLRLESGSSNTGDPNGPTLPTFSPSLHGWTVGGGFERALYGNWTGKVEYLYTRFSPVTITDQAGSTTLQLDLHTVKAGLNWRFGSDAVTARY